MKRGCTQCGECLNVCPVFALFKREEYAPKGKRLLMEPLDGWGAEEPMPWKIIRDLSRLCAGCERCKKACARKLSTSDLLAEVRASHPHWSQYIWDIWIRRAGPLWPTAGRLAAMFPDALTPEALENRLNALGALERNPFMRAIPLFLKDPVMRLSCDIAERDFTASLSNVGRITMPEALMPFLERFDVYCATRKMQLCVCSLGDTLSMGFTTSLVSTDVQRRFFRALTAMDLDVTIYANHPESR